MGGAVIAERRVGELVSGACRLSVVSCSCQMSLDVVQVGVTHARTHMQAGGCPAQPTDCMRLTPLLAASCAGVSEIVKYGLIRDAGLFDWLEANMGKILARDPAAVAHAVEQSCINKVGAVCVGVWGGVS